MLLDIGVTSGMQLEQILGLTKTAEKQGVTNIWVGEDIAGIHDVFTLVSIIMLRHRKMNVGIGITSPLIRNISTIARASVTLAQIGGSTRFRLGLGIGGLQDLAGLGITIKNPRSLLDSATTLLRSIWKRETLSFKGYGFVLERYRTRHGLRDQVPLFLGVRGPKLLRLAGRIADGVILSGPKTYLKKAIRLVKEGIEESPQPARDFKFVVWAPTILTEKPRDLTLVKRTVAFVLGDTPRKVTELAELNYDISERIKTVYQHHGILKASELVTEDLIEEASIHGNPKQICEAFQSLERLGAQEFVFGPPYGANPRSALRELAHAWRELS